MREALAELLRWWDRGDSGRGGDRRAAPTGPRPGRPARRCWSDRTAPPSGRCPAAASRVRCSSWRRRSATGRRRTLERYGVSDELAESVGVTCGGIIDLFVDRVDRTTFPEFGELAAADRGRRAGGGGHRAHRRRASDGTCWSSARPRASAVGGPAVSGRPGSTTPSPTTRSGLLEPRVGPAVLGYGPDGERRGEGLEVFVDSFAPPPRMIVFGAIDFAAAVARIGTLPRLPGDGLRRPAGVRDRPALPRRRRGRRRLAAPLPRRPGRRRGGGRAHGAVRADPRPEVRRAAAGRSRCGCRSATSARWDRGGPIDDRLAALRAAGLTDAQLGRLSSPIGLDLGARTPAETAVSIAAEIIAAQWRGRGRPLSELAGPIHHARFPPGRPPLPPTGSTTDRPRSADRRGVSSAPG